MSDEHIQLEPEEVQEIINWSIGTGSILAILHDTEYTEEDSVSDVIDRYINAVELMYHNLPDCLVGPSHEQAERIVESAEANEEEEFLIEQFRQELDGL